MYENFENLCRHIDQIEAVISLKNLAATLWGISKDHLFLTIPTLVKPRKEKQPKN
jgi:hypothetical protein